MGTEGSSSGKALRIYFYLLHSNSFCVGGVLFMGSSEALSRVKRLRKLGGLTFQGVSGEGEANSRRLIENVRMLERERVKLLGEVEVLRKLARSKVNALRGEVAVLREDEEVLKELLRILDTTTDQIRKLSKKSGSKR